MIFRCVLFFFIASVIGCSSTTPIANITLPPVTKIEGKIVEVMPDGLKIEDESGTIFVALNMEGQTVPYDQSNWTDNESISIYGNLVSGESRIFDGYVVDKATGERIIFTHPTPHVGIVIQSSFE